MDFNPRSYKRSDFIAQKSFLDYEISIHAPTRGATMKLPKICRKILISIHAPTRGATAKLDGKALGVTNFNPRSYKRSDKISRQFLRVLFDFNPRSYKRSDVS